MNFLHLKYAIVVSETGSISKAAEKLYVAQPNVSRGIKDLEQELGIVIFGRTSKGMMLTSDGERLIEYGKRLVRQMDEIEKAFKENKKKNVFSISVPRASYIAEAFVKFCDTLKTIDNIEIFYKETNAYRVINNILTDDYKLGIIRYSTNYDSYFKDLLLKKELHYELVCQFESKLVFSKNSPLAKNEKIYFSDLKDFIEIAHADPYVPSLSLSELSKISFSNGVTRRIFVFERASQFQLLSQNVVTFMWVSPIPKDVLERYNLIQVSCEDVKNIYKDLLIYRSDYTLNEMDKKFITFLCESKRMLGMSK